MCRNPLRAQDQHSPSCYNESILQTDNSNHALSRRKNRFRLQKAFGSEQSKHILISFLNALLDYQGGDTITDLTIIDPYQAPKILV
ncbi:MAG: PD-(D/E)XK nuclease family transposase [Thiolinea sp.]